MQTLKQFELRKVETVYKKEKLLTPDESSRFIKQFYFDDIEIYESCFIVMLNRQNQTMGYAKISQGGIVGTVVDVRLVCKYAIESLCTSIIMAHNHPSGQLKPSEADIRLTKRIKEALAMFDIDLVDHLILTKDSYFSLRDEYLL